MVVSSFKLVFLFFEVFALPFKIVERRFLLFLTKVQALGFSFPVIKNLSRHFAEEPLGFPVSCCLLLVFVIIVKNLFTIFPVDKLFEIDCEVT